MLPDASPVLRPGTVTAFDEPAGLGTLRDDDGTEVPFHCVAIADGTRTIEVGAAVTYRLVPRHLGRWEADELRPRTPPGA